MTTQRVITEDTQERLAAVQRNPFHWDPYLDTRLEHLRRKDKLTADEYYEARVIEDTRHSVTSNLGLRELDKQRRQATQGLATQETVTTQTDHPSTRLQMVMACKMAAGELELVHRYLMQRSREMAYPQSPHPEEVLRAESVRNAYMDAILVIQQAMQRLHEQGKEIRTHRMHDIPEPE